jgi:hypothetical protein
MFLSFFYFSAMMKRLSVLPVLLFSIVLIFGFTACQSGRNMVESGNYDGAVDFYAHKLRGKKKKKTDHVKGLELAFRKAQNRDLNTANHLINTGRPENWERVNDLHRQIRRRQNKVAPLLPLVANDGYRATLEFVDIAALEAESCRKAADYLYDKASELVSRAAADHDKSAAREAYELLVDLENRYFRDYRESRVLKTRARELGTSYILVDVQNNSGRILPIFFSDRLLAMSKRDLDSEWKDFSFQKQNGIDYDYRVVFKVRNIDVSPERIHERAYTDEKEIQDGKEYVLDDKGNVKKDTNGNDITRPRFIRIRANVVEVFQSKAARLSGHMEIYDAHHNNMLDMRDLSTEVLFENYASTFIGDKRALSDESCRRIGNSPQPFPLDEDMLVQAAERLKPNLREELRRSRAIL